MKTQVYYDGLCIVCSKEIDHYRRLKGAENLEFVDIKATDFDPRPHGLDPKKIDKVMHVKDAQGIIHEGLDAFKAIWSQLPRYRFLLKIADNPLVRPLLNVGYVGFTKIRPFLPRKKIDCESGNYCNTK